MTRTILSVALMTCTVIFIYSTQSHARRCASISESCAQLRRTNGEHIETLEGCDCPPDYICNLHWETNNPMVPTWIYPLLNATDEQMKFCERKPLRICDAEETPGIQVNNKEYEFKCKCHNNVAVLDRERFMNGKWTKTYKCHKTNCVSTEDCFRTYIRKSSHSIGTVLEYPCLCPTGSVCVTRTTDSFNLENEGHYYFTKCKQQP